MQVCADVGIPDEHQGLVVSWSLSLEQGRSWVEASARHVRQSIISNHVDEVSFPFSNFEMSSPRPRFYLRSLSQPRHSFSAKPCSGVRLCRERRITWMRLHPQPRGFLSRLPGHGCGQLARFHLTSLCKPHRQVVCAKPWPAVHLYIKCMRLCSIIHFHPLTASHSPTCLSPKCLQAQIVEAVLGTAGRSSDISTVQSQS